MSTSAAGPSTARRSMTGSGPASYRSAARSAMHWASACRRSLARNERSPFSGGCQACTIVTDARCRAASAMAQSSAAADAFELSTPTTIRCNCSRGVPRTTTIGHEPRRPVPATGSVPTINSVASAASSRNSSGLSPRVASTRSEQCLVAASRVAQSRTPASAAESSRPTTKRSIAGAASCTQPRVAGERIPG